MADALLPTLDDVYKAPDVGTASQTADDLYKHLDSTFQVPQLQILEQQGTVAANAAAAAQKAVADREALDRELEDAQAQRSEIDNYPTFLTNIMGLFDPKWSWNTQNDRVRAAKQHIQSNEDTILNQTRAASLAGDAATTQLKMLELQHSNMSAEIDRALKTRTTIENERHIRFAESMQAASNARDQMRLGMEKERFAIDQQLKQDELGKTLAGQLLDDQIDAVIADPNAAPATKQYAINEKHNRQIIAATIDNNALTIANHKITNEDAIMQLGQNVLNIMDDTHLKILQKQAAQNGGTVDIYSQNSGNKITVTGPMIDTALSVQEIGRKSAGERMGSAVEYQASKALIMGKGGSVDRIMQTALQLTGAQNTAGNVAAMPQFANLRDLYASKLAGAEAKASISHDYSDANKIVQEYAAEAQKLLEKQINNSYTEKERPLVFSMVNGNLPSASTAADYFQSSALAPQSLISPAAGPDSRYQPLLNDLYSAVRELVTKKYGINAGPNVDINAVFDAMSTQKIDKQQVILEALTNANLNYKWRELRNQDAVNTAFDIARDKIPVFKDLASVNNANFGTPQIDPDTKLVRKDANGNPIYQVNIQNVFNYLNKRYEMDVAAGTLKPITVQLPDGSTGMQTPLNYAEQFRRILMSSAVVQAIHNHWTQGMGPTGFAMGTLMHQAAPEAGWLQWAQGAWDMHAQQQFHADEMMAMKRTQYQNLVDHGMVPKRLDFDTWLYRKGANMGNWDRPQGTE